MIRVNGEWMEWTEGMTVQDMLNRKGYDFALIIVTIDDRLIPDDEYDETRIPDHADVKALHIHHGG